MARREKDPWNFFHPNGESSQMVQESLRPFIKKICDIDGLHIIVTHGVVSKIIRGMYLDLTTEEVFSLDRPQDAFHKLHNGKIQEIKVELH